MAGRHAFVTAATVSMSPYHAVRRNCAMMKALITLCVSGAIAASAVPSFAQSYYDEGSVAGSREAAIRDRINDGFASGDLSASQAGQLRSELRQIVNLDARYQDEGMSGWQARDLNSRLSLLDSRLNYDLSTNRDADDYGY